jgi:TRAP-type C4-dicarboxylate transport system permease small subunit
MGVQGRNPTIPLEEFSFNHYLGVQEMVSRLSSMAKVLPKVPQILEPMNKLLCRISGFLLFVIVLLVGFSVLGRYFFNKPILGAIEISEFLFVFALFFALAYTQSRGRHIRVRFIIVRLPPRPRRILNILVYALSAIFFLVVGWQAGIGAWKSWMIREGSYGAITFPIYPARFAIVFGCIVIALQFVKDIFAESVMKE